MIQSLQVPTATLIDQNGKAIDNVKLVMVCVCGGRGGGGEGRCVTSLLAIFVVLNCD